MPNSSIRYLIDVTRPGTHLVSVTMEIDHPPSPTEIRLPVWTPGSYMVREFARHVQGFRAYLGDGTAAPWRKSRKDTWLIEPNGPGPLRVEFEVYANDLTVRTSHVDLTHAFLNPANLLPYVVGRTDEPLAIRVSAPDTWRVVCPLAPFDENLDWFEASDYDELVDSPIHIGPDPIYRFEVEGKPHALAVWGRGSLDPTKLLADIQRIITIQGKLFGGLPYERYAFILLLTDGAGGGLEHRSSCSLMVPRFRFRPGRPYERSLQLIAHEFFHTWNVKRIRPAALGPFDYSAENYTRLLWAMEGITDYYTSLSMQRAGLLTVERYLQILGEQMSDEAETPGRLVQSLEEASFDAWIKYYRPDEHSVNSSISYYRKGALASLLLDLELRRRSRGAQSLDNMMQLLWQRYGEPEIGVPEDGYETAAAELVPGDWRPFFDQVIRGRGDLEYASALAAVGIEIEWRTDPALSGVWLGLLTRTEAGRLKITTVLSNGPCHSLGLAAGDEILALDGFRVDETSLAERLYDYQADDSVQLTVFHRDELTQVNVELAARPATRATLRRVKRATVSQQTLLGDWLRFAPAIHTMVD